MNRVIFVFQNITTNIEALNTVIQMFMMTETENELQYKASMERIEELLPLVTDETPLTDKNLVELELLSNLVADYEEAHYPINNTNTLSTQIKK